MTLKEKVDELNTVTGSVFTEETGTDCINFYYEEVVENKQSLLDTDEYAALNTILGYDIGRETAQKISKDLWEHDVDLMALDLDPGSRITINDAAKRCGVILDWSKWKSGVMDGYEYFPRK